MEPSKDIVICAKCGEHHPRCSGHKKRKNSEDGKLHPCMRYPLKGNKGCKLHKKGVNVGEKNGNFKTGRYSKYLAKDIDQTIRDLNNARENGDYLTLKDNIDLIEVRITQLTEQLSSSASEKTWREIKRARRDIAKAVRGAEVDVDTILESLTVLDDISGKGLKEHRAWDELMRVQSHFRSLLESEMRLLLQKKFMLSLDEVQIILRMISHAIKEEVSDANIRKNLAQRIGIISTQAGVEIG